MTAIEFKKVSFNYEDCEQKILKETDFSVDYGEIALLAGFSGEGKSTVLSLIGGIIPNVTPGDIEGDILIDGKSILGEKMSSVCRKVGMVLQNADSQIVQQTVEDEIAFGCENFAFEKEKIKNNIDKACTDLHLLPVMRTRTLSGGQKQRLITATTLATEQKIIVLDEPLANLDREGSEFLMAVLRKKADEGYAVLVVEHRLDMIVNDVDTVWNISDGKLNRVEDKLSYLKKQTKVIEDICKTEETKETVFKLRHLAFSVKKKEILKDITFEIKKGERVLLLGENGCGKTTLSRLLAKLYKPTGGSIETPLSVKYKKSKQWFKHVGVIYQNPNYQLFMPTVFQEIAYGAVSNEYAKEIMKLFKLTHLSERHPQSLSEGQKRRVSIAAVVASKPEVLLLDEPTVGQDYKGLSEMIDILNRLHEETNNTMITVTHDKRCAEALCDHAVVIKDGKIAEDGGKALVRDYFG